MVCRDFNIDFAKVSNIQRYLVSIFVSFGLSMHENTPNKITSCFLKALSLIQGYYEAVFSKSSDSKSFTWKSKKPKL